jgi:hypothetical protein
MTEMGSSALEIVARTLLVYLGVLVGLRLMGKRELAQMTVFDLVMILLIANAVQNAMTGPDFSVQGGPDSRSRPSGRQPPGRLAQDPRRGLGPADRGIADRSAPGR